MNPDKLMETNEVLASAIKDGNTEKFVDELHKVMNKEILDSTKEEVLRTYKELGSITDENVLASRGINALTSEEKNFYKSLIDRAEGKLTGPEVTMPKTTENKIFEDVTREHPLLGAINFVNSKGLTEWILSKNLDYAYKWGDLNDPVTEEANAAFAKVEFSQFKLSCWIPVPKTMLDLGMTWLDQFVVKYLSEIMARAIEKAIIAGTGQKQPVGMMKTIDIENQTTPAEDKEATAITELNTVTIGGIAALLSDNGKRKVGTIDLIVNPIDYWTKIYPAIYYTDASGKVSLTNLPLRVYQSLEVPSNKAIFGLVPNYFATAGFGVPNGKIEYSDHYKFLDDVRVFKARAVVYGTPKDNTSFLVRDISQLEPAVMTVKVKNTAAAGQETSAAKGTKA